jgi:hypothetical protein
VPLPPAAAVPPSNLKPNPDEEPDPESITQVEPCVARCRGRHTPLHLAVEKALGAFEGQKMARPRERSPSTLPIREGGELSCPLPGLSCRKSRVVSAQVAPSAGAGRQQVPPRTITAAAGHGGGGGAEKAPRCALHGSLPPSATPTLHLVGHQGVSVLAPPRVRALGVATAPASPYLRGTGAEEGTSSP